MTIGFLRVHAQEVSNFAKYYSQTATPDFVELLPDSSATVNMFIPDSVFFARSEQAIFKVNLNSATL